MPRHNRRALAVMAGMVWLMLRAPIDVIMFECSHAMLPYIASLQLTDFFVLVYIFYSFLTQRSRRPWRCPVCDGWGVRSYVPGMLKDLAALLTKCAACKGEGYIWEHLEDDK